MRRAIASARWGSPPSSSKTTLTGCPARPPRLLTSAIQAQTATGMGATSAPRGPEPTPNDPSTMGDLAADAGGAPVSRLLETGAGPAAVVAPPARLWAAGEAAPALATASGERSAAGAAGPPPAAGGSAAL